MRRGALSAGGRADGREHLPLPHVPEGGRRAVHGLRRRAESEFVITRGAISTFASSDIAERGFCAECGTPLTYRGLGSERISVTLGSLDDPDAVEPETQLGVESRLRWLDARAERSGDANGTMARTGEDCRAVRNRQHPDRET